jgi:hypothetical protein
MQYRTVTERVGELLGPIDWSYDFHQHDCGNPVRVDECVEKLRTLEAGIANGEQWQATTDGGWPRVGWGRVRAVGMYDGWPFWRPTPSVDIDGVFGGEWHYFGAVTDIALSTCWTEGVS